MGDSTKIEWADRTLNFWIGCTQLKRAGGSAGGVAVFRVGKKAAGRLLDGTDYTEFPAERLAA